MDNYHSRAVCVLQARIQSGEAGSSSTKSSDSKLPIDSTVFQLSDYSIQFILSTQHPRGVVARVGAGECYAPFRGTEPCLRQTPDEPQALRCLICGSYAAGVRGAKSLVLFLEGGGWCFPSDMQQPSGPTRTDNTSGANCHTRSVRLLEGGTVIISGDPTLTGFADFADFVGQLL